MVQSFSLEISVFHLCEGGEKRGKGIRVGFSYVGIFHLMAEFQGSLPGRTDWLSGLEIRKIQTAVPVNEICAGQARTCQAAHDGLELNLITNALAGESMSSAKSLHS